MSSIVSDGYDLVATSTLHPHPDNRRRGNVEKIRRSIRDNGFFGSVLVQRRTDAGETPGPICAGEHRWRAATLENLDEIPVVWLDADDATAARIVLADNKASDDADYDQEGLIEVLRRYDPAELEKTLFAQSDLDELLRVTGVAGREAAAFLNGIGSDNPQPPAPPEPPGRPGQGDWVAFSVTVLDADRALIIAAINEAKRKWQVATSGDALLRILAEWSETTTRVEA